MGQATLRALLLPGVSRTPKTQGEQPLVLLSPPRAGQKHFARMLSGSKDIFPVQKQLCLSMGGCVG